MTPDDPRHGSYAGAIAHYMSDTPTCDPCKAAAADYRRNRRARLYLARTNTLEVNPLGSIRRIQALVRLGHPMRAIDDLVGWHHGTTSRFIVANHKTTHRTTANKIAAAYDALYMTVPEGPYAVRNQRLAERKGWLPPLAWNDIDDVNEKPRAGTNHRRKDDIDPAVVERVLSGDLLPTTNAERVEITRRWEARGRSLKTLERFTGWKSERYTTREDGAA